MIAGRSYTICSSCLQRVAVQNVDNAKLFLQIILQCQSIPRNRCIRISLNTFYPDVTVSNRSCVTAALPALRRCCQSLSGTEPEEQYVQRLIGAHSQVRAMQCMQQTEYPQQVAVFKMYVACCIMLQ